MHTFLSLNSYLTRFISFFVHFFVDFHFEIIRSLFGITFLNSSTKSTSCVLSFMCLVALFFLSSVFVFFFVAIKLALHVGGCLQISDRVITWFGFVLFGSHFIVIVFSQSLHFCFIESLVENNFEKLTQ